MHFRCKIYFKKIKITFLVHLNSEKSDAQKLHLLYLYSLLPIILFTKQCEAEILTCNFLFVKWVKKF